MDKRLEKKLRFGTQYHTWVLDQINRRRRYSEQKFANRYDKWRQDDEAFVSYMPEKDQDMIRRNQREQGGTPQFTTLYIPFDYAVLMSAHTYMTSVFLGRNPVFQYQGVSGEGESGSLAVETLMNYQMNCGRLMPPLYVWLMDGGKYGLGVVGHYWDECVHYVTREIDVPDEFLGVPLASTHKELVTAKVEGYKGNRLYNVRPYDFLPDPRCTPANFQQGEFCGRVTDISWNEVVKQVKGGSYHAANAKALKDGGNSADGRWFTGQTSVVEYPDNALQSLLTGETNGLKSYELLEMYIELIPKEWELGESDYPEKWLFVVAAGNVILAAQPLGTYANKYPFAVIEYEIDGYAMFKRGLMELAKPMTDVITWLINTHFYNTRKSLNDMFVVDPSRVVLKDVKDPNPGKIIRLKPEAMGTDVRTAVTQLQTGTVTQGHINDTAVMAQLIQRVTGVNDSIMGLMQGGGRKTATEVRTSSSFGINRLKTVTEWISATGWGDLSMSLLDHSQQFYDSTTKLRIAGAQYQYGQKFLEISPQDIAGQFDFVPVDGTLPVDRYAQVNLWSQLLGQMSQVPDIMMQYDLGKIFGWIAQLGGLKNVDQFKIQVGSPEYLQKQAQMGNMVPAGGGGGPNGAARGPERARGNGGAPTPRRVGSMGPSG